MLLTALGSTSDKTKGLDSGADDYLVKPFALEELLARVRALLPSPRRTKGTVLKAADLELDTTTFRGVTRAGKISLSEAKSLRY